MNRQRAVSPLKSLRHSAVHQLRTMTGKSFQPGAGNTASPHRTTITPVTTPLPLMVSDDSSTLIARAVLNLFVLR